MRRGKRSGNARTRKEKGGRESRGEGELVFVKKKKEYDFEIGRLKVQNLTRYRLKTAESWEDGLTLSQKSEEITERVNCEAIPEVREDKIITTEEEPIVGVEVSLDLKKSVNTRISLLGDDSDDFPYAIQELANPNPDEEEKQIHSNFDLIEKKRLEALKKLNKKRQDRIESNRLMALYRLSMRQSGSAEHDSKSVYLTQEQIKRINQSKTQALQKRHKKMNGDEGSSQFDHKS